ncbi:Transcription factor Iwr1 [Ceratobasidium sp. AG-Ba]|nr:Transcription factor Iwr1 [Ceratobasidium sp. AG-Ba]
MAMASNDTGYSRAIFVKRKRVDEPMDALMIDLPSQSKRYRGSVVGPADGRGMFTLAETLTEDPSLLDDEQTKHLHKRLALINQEPRASPKVASPAAMSISPTNRIPAQTPREYKVLRKTRAPISAAVPHTKSSEVDSRAPVPIPVPGQPLPVTTGTGTGAKVGIDNDNPTPSAFVLYEAVPAGATEVEQTQESAPEMEEFQDLLKEYLKVNDISLDAPPPRKPVAISSPHVSKKTADAEEEEYVWDVFYQRADLSGDLSVWDGLANVGTLSGLPPTEGDILADEADSDSVKDEADEDSNEEDFYRNDYPDTESEESEEHQSDGEHEWR